MKNRIEFSNGSIFHCPLCGQQRRGTQQLAAHFVSGHGFAKARAFTLANLLFLDVGQTICAENTERVLQMANELDVSQAQIERRRSS